MEILLALIIWTICAVAAGQIAKGRGADPGGWYAAGFLLGPIGVVVAFLAAHPTSRQLQAPTPAALSPRTPSATPIGRGVTRPADDWDYAAPAERTFVPRYCQFCGAARTPDARYCSTCGQAFQLPVASAAAEDGSAPAETTDAITEDSSPAGPLSLEIPELAGPVSLEIPEPPADLTTPETGQRKSRVTPRRLLAVGVVLLLVAVGAAVGFGGQRSGSATAATTRPSLGSPTLAGGVPPTGAVWFGQSYDTGSFAVRNQVSSVTRLAGFVLVAHLTTAHGTGPLTLKEYRNGAAQVSRAADDANCSPDETLCAMGLGPLPDPGDWRFELTSGVGDVLATGDIEVTSGP